MEAHEQELINLIGVPVAVYDEEFNGHTVHYAMAGQGPALLCIHGLNLGWGQWYPNIAYLSRFFTLYLVDLPGSGASSKIRYADVDVVRDYIETVEEFIKKKQLKNFSVVGHSLGGWIAAQLSIRGRVPIASLALVSPIGFSSYLSPNFFPVSFRFIARLLKNVIVKPTYINLKAIISQPLKKGFKVHEIFVKYYCESLWKRGDESHPFLFINRMCLPLRLHSELLLGDIAHTVAHPVLVLLGYHDPLVVPHRSVAAIRKMPNSTVVILDTGHVPTLESPEESNRRIKDFFMKE